MTPSRIIEGTLDRFASTSKVLVPVLRAQPRHFQGGLRDRRGVLRGVRARLTTTTTTTNEATTNETTTNETTTTTNEATTNETTTNETTSDTNNYTTTDITITSTDETTGFDTEHKRREQRRTSNEKYKERAEKETE